VSSGYQSPETGCRDLGNSDHPPDATDLIAALQRLTHKSLIIALQLLTIKFPTDYLFWRELGEEFYLQKMYQDAGDAYDTSIRILLAKAGTDIDSCAIPNLKCDGCFEGLRGYYYKCATCVWHRNYCQRCAFHPPARHDFKCPGPSLETLSIPSRRPFSL
jgi:hypothetical protein